MSKYEGEHPEHEVPERPAPEPSTQGVLKEGVAVIPRAPVVLVDNVTTKVKTPSGYEEQTTTREERHASQIDAASRRVTRLKTHHKQYYRQHTMTSSMDGLPELKPGQDYGIVKIEGFQHNATPLSELVVRHGYDSSDDKVKVRYIRGRMRPGQIRDHRARR